MKYEFTEQSLNNLMIFLNRISITGLKELTAMNEILNVLNQPIKKDILEENKYK